MRKRDIKRQNIIQLLFVITILILVSYVSSFVFHRFDLTSEKRYTLSNTAKDLMRNLDDIVYIKVYLEGDLNVGFKRMCNSIRELLDEFRVYAGDNIEYEFINPYEITDKEVRNEIFRELINKGLQRTALQERDTEGKTSQKTIFPGAIINYKERELALNMLKNIRGLSGEENLNNSIQTLEYEFINAIKKLSSDKIQKIAFIEGHGELDGYQVGDITDELAEYCEVYRGWINTDTNSLDDYFAIIIAKPKYPFSEKEKFVIDQYIMNGGKVLWLIDVINVNYDTLARGSTTIALINSLNIEDQLFKYGVRINPSLVKDLQCAIIPVNIALFGEQPKFAPAPWCYFPLIAPPDNHSITKNLNDIKSEFANVIDTVGGNQNIKKTFLLRTSRYTKVVNAPLMISLEHIHDKLQPAEFNHSFQPIAVLLEGKFESVFKNRPISDFFKGKALNFKSESVETKMIVIADGDIIKNEVSSRGGRPLPLPLGFDRYTQQTFGNKEFIMNAINYLSDDADLMHLRSRELKLRLLNRAKISQERFKWQLINTVLPVAFVIVFGLIIGFIRGKKFGQIKLPAFPKLIFFSVKHR